MTASPALASAPLTSSPHSASPVRPRRIPRLLGLAAAELSLLRRNRMQLGTAILLPLALPFFFLPLAQNGASGAALASVLGTMFVIVLLFVVYYNLLSSYVARRQDLVLKRLRTGEASDATVLAATATPALLLAAVMIVLTTALAIPLLDLPLPQNPLVLVLGLGLGALMLVPLALVTANITRTVESAQITSLPAMLVLMIGAGGILPVELLPDWAARLITFLPSAPITELVRLGWLGIDADGAAMAGADAWMLLAGQTGILLAWTLVGALIVREHFRWEPRG
ncbi:ABC transporter permease [Brachybacterium paraconglomeratum]|uniref:ABC transporter permease n=1 Tax=Brachybacterium paraconglomeratum TaxID=173362 RepID=UPI0031E6FDCB